MAEFEDLFAWFISPAVGPMPLQRRAKTSTFRPLLEQLQPSIPVVDSAEPPTSSPAVSIERAGPVPTRGLFADSILSRIRSELRPLYDELQIAMEERPVSQVRVKKVLLKFREVYATAGIAGRVAGMLTPWAPSLNSKVPPSKRPKPVDQQAKQLAIWPVFEQAMGWLTQTIQLDPNKLAGIITRERLQSYLYGAEIDGRTLDSLNRQLYESIEAGEGRDEWRDRVKGILDARAGFDETIARTSTHRSYLAGQREILAEPVIVDMFPYRRYFATMDNRSRPTHRAMHEKVYHKDSDLAREAASILDEYNCRCSEVPLTEKQALGIGISDGGEPPDGIRVEEEMAA